MPGPLNFSAVTGAADCEFIESESAIITAITQPVALSIFGGEYQLNGGGYTSAPATVTVGDTLRLRVSCSDLGGTINTASINVGGATAEFAGTTAIDAVTDAIEFTPVIDAPLNSEQVSNTVTISGINTAIAIAITGGEYAIDGAEFTSAPGTISAGQHVIVRAIAPSTVGSVTAPTTTTAALTLGDATYNFTVSAITDSTAPTAEFMFPPPASMTEAPEIFTRIKFTDDYGQIVAVEYQINDGARTAIDLDATPFIVLPDGSLELRHTFALPVEGDNQLRIIATDAVGNEMAADAQPVINVRHDPSKGWFPSMDVPVWRAMHTILDTTQANTRILFWDDVKDKNASDRLRYLDLATGERTIAAIDTSKFRNLDGMILVKIGNATKLALFTNAGMYTADINPDGGWSDLTKVVRENLNIRATGGIFQEFKNGVLSDLIVPSNDGSSAVLRRLSPNLEYISPVTDVSDLSAGPQTSALNFITSDGEHVYAVAGASKTIMKINISTGERSWLSTKDIGGGYPILTDLPALAYDKLRDNLIVLNRSDEVNAVLRVNPITGFRTEFSTSETPNTINKLGFLDALVVHSDDTYFIVADIPDSTFSAVDMETGYRVIISKTIDN